MYRKSGLFGKDNNQEGAIPVILALLVFTRIIQPDQFVWSTALTLESLNCEVDFSVFQYGRGKRVQVAIGECKDSGGNIDHNDLGNLKVVRQKLVEAGFDCFITLAKTADTFDPDELELFREVAKDGLKLILLTNREMEPYSPFVLDNKDIPHKYADSLGELAENTMHRHLPLTVEEC
jgi:hypothetical protein